MGNPAGLVEAFSWGVINLAPWIAAVEIGRSVQSLTRVAVLLLAALLISLVLETAIHLEWPTAFDAVRRIPAALITVAALGVFRLIGLERPHEDRRPVPIEGNCLWARSSGNYVELHFPDGRSTLVRGTIKSIVDNADSRLVRIHRSFAISRDEVDRVERSNVKLKDGTRLPIGNSFREHLSKL